jgi:hypothetical protein
VSPSIGCCHNSADLRGSRPPSTTAPACGVYRKVQFWGQCCSFCTPPPHPRPPSVVAWHGLHPSTCITRRYSGVRFVTGWEVEIFINRLTECVDDVTLWTRSNRLQTNAGKTEYTWFTAPRRVQQLPVDAISIGGHDILRWRRHLVISASTSTRVAVSVEPSTHRRHHYQVLCDAASIPCRPSVRVSCYAVPGDVNGAVAAGLL